MKDYYKILEISRTASNSEIPNAFRRLAKKYHPDVNRSLDASDRFKEIYEAYEILKDPQKRRVYDDIILAKDGPANSIDVVKKFNEWTGAAQNKGKIYADIRFKEFFFWVLKETSNASASVVSGIVGLVSYTILYFTFMTVSLVELILVIFIGILSPILSFQISQRVGIITLAISVLFFVFYFKTKKSYGQFWLYVLEGVSYVGLKSLIFILFFSYSIVITNLSLAERKNNITKRERAFDDSIADINLHMNEYSNTFTHNQEISPTIKPSIVVINMSKNSVDDLFKELPDSLKAYKHSDVKTIVQLWREEEQIGYYQGGGSAIQRTCIYKFINFEELKCVEFDTIIGSPPPLVINHRGDGFGSDPIVKLKEIILDRLK